MAKLRNVTTKDTKLSGPTETFPIDAHPAKAFFVWMITRDIALADAILDLLDNSVDGARRSGLKDSKKPFEGYWAEITFDERHFRIWDNCGGIPRDVAEEYAFKFGRPTGSGGKNEGTVGVYGIGMKRAIFKLGRSATVTSRTEKEAFSVRIDPTWLNDDKNWKLHAKGIKLTNQTYGADLHIDILHDHIARHFREDSPFTKEFPKLVEAAMSLLIERGFKIKVNGKVLGSSLFSLLWTPPGKRSIGVRPYFYRAIFPKVSVFLAVGFRNRVLTDTDTPEEETASWDSNDAGWTVACNDRIVLSCDKTRISGWESRGVPRYHAQFRAISGFVEFHAKEPVELPMTTTKRGVDPTGIVYQSTLERMSEGLKLFTRATNEWKGEEDELNSILDAAESVKIPELRGKVERLPGKTFKGNKDEIIWEPMIPHFQTVRTTKRISFSRSISEIERVSEFLFEDPTRSPSDVGIACFERVLLQAKK